MNICISNNINNIIELVIVEIGAIFNKIGFGFAILLFSITKVESNFSNGSRSCSARRLGVLGEETLTTK